MDKPADYVSRFGHLEDDAWLEILLRTVKGDNESGLPGFPPEDTQANFVGSSGESALCEGYNFYRLLKEYTKTFSGSLNSASRVLDFGVGWGRIVRFFLKDLPASNLYGVDVDPDILDVCRDTGISANLDVISPAGSLPYPEDTFDLIYAYSVFSHLSEAEHKNWLQEISRVLKPGGMFIATTEARHFISYCKSLTEEDAQSNWHKTLLLAFPDPERALRDYDEGQYIFAPTGGGDYRSSDFYGEAAIPRKYVENVWTDHLVLRDFIEDKDRFWQAVIVTQHPRTQRDRLKAFIKGFFGGGERRGGVGNSTPTENIRF